jgi:hypothetical protein
MIDRQPLKDRIAGLCLVGSALALLLANGISPDVSSSDARQLEIVAAHGPRQYISAVLALVALAFLLPAGLGLAGKLRGRWASHGVPGAALLVIGVVATATATALALVEWRASRPGLDRGQMTELIHRLDTNTGVAAVFISGIAVPLGLAVIALGLARDRALSPVLAVLVVLGPAIVDAGYTVNSLPLAIAGSAVMVVGYGLVSRALFFGSRAVERSVLDAAASKL